MANQHKRAKEKTGIDINATFSKLQQFFNKACRMSLGTL